ncbi:transposase, partial [Streptococcus thoraltensis]
VGRVRGNKKKKQEMEVACNKKKPKKKQQNTVLKSEGKEKKTSPADSEIGAFHKGEHKEVFSYAAQVACDKHGWACAYRVEAGNVHDSQGFPARFAQIEPFQTRFLIADSGEKTPSVATFLLETATTPVFPSTQPRGFKGKIRPKDFFYGSYFDCYLCPKKPELTFPPQQRTFPYNPL